MFLRVRHMMWLPCHSPDHWTDWWCCSSQSLSYHCFNFFSVLPNFVPRRTIFARMTENRFCLILYNFEMSPSPISLMNSSYLTIYLKPQHRRIQYKSGVTFEINLAVLVPFRRSLPPPLYCNSYNCICRTRTTYPPETINAVLQAKSSFTVGK